MNKRSYAFILLLLVSISLPTKAQTPSNLRLSVKGNQIVNPQNEPAQLRGISFSWSIWQGKKYYNTQVLDWLQSDFKASVLRLSMAVQPSGGYLEQADEQKELICNLADRAIERGLYVIIDWHDHNAEQHLEQSKKFFSDIAKRYSGKPNVIYEIWNEPERQDWNTVKSYAMELIHTIRKYDHENLILVGSPHWDQDVDVVANDPIRGFENIAYTFHFYASDPRHQKELRSKARYAIDQGLPLLVSEWGVGEANGDGKFSRRKTKIWLKWMEDNKLSWVNWNITDKKETTALLKPGAATAGGWTKAELTPAGNYIRKVLRQLNRN